MGRFLDMITHAADDIVGSVGIPDDTGERVPDFSLKDQSGKVWTLKSIMGPKGAMLVFVRSADW